VQYSGEPLEEQKGDDATAEQQLPPESCPAAASPKLPVANMGAEDGRNDRDHDDGGQLGKVACREDGWQNRWRSRHKTRQAAVPSHDGAGLIAMTDRTVQVTVRVLAPYHAVQRTEIVLRFKVVNRPRIVRGSRHSFLSLMA
jgi:hypothetical protein